MTIGYNGSNFGVVSVLNSGNGTLTTIGDTFEGNFENVRNYTLGTLSLLVSSFTNLLVNITIHQSQDETGTKSITKKILSIYNSQTVEIKIESNFFKIELELVEGSSVNFSLQTIYKNSITTNSPNGVLSFDNNLTNQSLNSGDEYIGTFENISSFSSMTVMTKSNIGGSGTLFIDFSNNGSNVQKTFTTTIQDVSSTDNVFNPIQTQIMIGNYVRVRFLNTSTNTFTDLNITVLYHNSTLQNTLTPNDKITTFHPSTLQQSILTAPTLGSILEGNSFRSIQSFQNSLNVNIKSPNTAFGEMLMAYNTPFLQFDFSNGQPLDQIQIYQNVPFSLNYKYSFQNAKAIIESDDGNSPQKIELKSIGFTKYKAGQGIDHRMTGRFPSGYQTYCDQYVGVFTAQDSLCYGYFRGESEFSIRYQKFGTQQLDRITVSGTVSATTIITFTINSSETLNVTLSIGDTPNVIAAKCVTEFNNAIGIAIFGYKCQYYYLGTNTSIYYIDVLSNQTNSSTISVSINPYISITNIVSSNAPTTEIIPQRDWNINTCKDMGSLQTNYERNPTGFILDPSKGNVFRIHFQYLGFGAITFFIEQNESDTLIPVHQIKYQNNNDSPSLKNPSMNIGIGIETDGSSSSSVSNAVVESASMASFLQGKFISASIYRSFANTLLSNQENGVNRLTRENPAMICGIQGLEIFESSDSDGTINYNVNRTNIYFNTINFSINANATNTSSNIVLMLIKNPKTIVSIPSSQGLTIQKRNNDNVLYVSGLPVLGSPSVITQAIQPNDFSVVFEYTLIEQDSLILDISNLNILMSPNDSYYLCFYGNLEGSGNAELNVSGSVSYSVNM